MSILRIAKRKNVVDLSGDWFAAAIEADLVWLRLNHPEKIPLSVLRNLRPSVSEADLISGAYLEAHRATTGTCTVAELSVLLSRARENNDLALAYWCAQTALERAAVKRSHSHRPI